MASHPSRIRLEFLKRVREERKFDSPEALKSQILQDVKRAIHLLPPDRRFEARVIKFNLGKSPERL